MNKARRMRLPENSAYPKFHETHIEDAWCAQAGCIPVCPLPAEEFPIEVAPSRSAACKHKKHGGHPLEGDESDIRMCEEKGCDARSIDGGKTWMTLKEYQDKCCISASAAPPSEREADDGEIVLHYGKAPCGHSERFLYTEDGGKHIVCLVCEYNAARAAVPQAARHPELRGTWPENCVQRAFVEGAKWWEFYKTGATMWQSDQRLAEKAAVEQYGEPGAAAVAAPGGELFGRAMIVLKGLNLSVEWELTPVIKAEIAAICEEFEAGATAPPKEAQ